MQLESKKHETSQWKLRSVDEHSLEEDAYYNGNEQCKH